VIQLGLWLGAIGLADLVAGLSGRPASRIRVAIGSVCAVAVASLGSAVFGLHAADGVVMVLLVGASAVPWLAVRLSRVWSQRQAIAASLGFGGAVVAMAAVAGTWPATSGGAVARWLHGLPYGALRGVPADRLALVGGSALVLGATANALVRLVLAAVGTDVAAPEERLRGGRIIGPMERLLIFAFAVAGQPTAAALVVSAKSLLRFPEISRSEQRIDEITEYFLVGSMSSWLLALAPLVLLAR
jgi:hypothetical protein